MAGAYARIAGKLGVAMASNGPGVANALPGVAVEQAEGNRVLLITSSRRGAITYPDRGGAYQYFDQVGVIKGMAKWSATVGRAERIPELTRMALRHCFEGRPGVVHLDVAEDLMNGKFKFDDPIPIMRYRASLPPHPAPEAVEQAAKMLAQAELPIIQAGSGVIHAGAYAELQHLAEVLYAPVTTSWSGRGVLPETHELAWPLMHIKAVNAVRNAADLVLCLGARLGETDWWGKPPNWRPAGEQKMIQVDLEYSALGRTKPVDLAVQADIKAFLNALNDQLARIEMEGGLEREGRKRAVAGLAKERDKDRAKLDEKLEDKDAPMLTAHVAHICRQEFADDAVVVFDGGNTAVWGNFYHQVRAPNTMLTTPHFGHLGAGVAQALGAAVARPEAQVYCIIGDGAMGFHPQEIETAIRNRLNVIYLVVADRQWGMVKMNQQFALKPVKTMIKKSLEPSETINTDLGEIAWDKLAESMGAYGERVSKVEELAPAVERCLIAEKCAVIHVDVDPVKHMWAPGLLHFKEMHNEPGGK
jgi:acetolactate synthase-1/2/3 large subunit